MSSLWFRNVNNHPFKYLKPRLLHSFLGSVTSEETLEQIAQISKDRDIVLFSDEMYLLTKNKFDAEKRKPVTMVSKYDNAISLFGMSKTFALPGMTCMIDLLNITNCASRVDILRRRVKPP